jgi:MOSC domain-containing protein YiiM
MQLISVNIGEERILARKNRLERTGIYKVPTRGPLRVTRLGLEKDVIVSKKHHGGPDQAIYVYGMPDYAWWSQELGRELAPGTFGDNLTISDLESASFNIGDMLHVGEVVLQITAPRIPCGTFAARMEDPHWVKKFRDAGRPGLYCRVLMEGLVQAGDPATVESYTGETISVLEMYREFYVKNKSRESLLRHLQAPIAIRARKDIESEMRSLSNE